MNMFSKFVSCLISSLIATLFFAPSSQTIKFKTTIGRVSYILDTVTKTASINRVYVYWPEDTKVILPIFLKYVDVFFKVTDIDNDAFKNYVSLDISEINVPKTINKTKENKNEYLKIFKGLSEKNKAEIIDFFSENKV